MVTFYFQPFTGKHYSRWQAFAVSSPLEADLSRRSAFAMCTSFEKHQFTFAVDNSMSSNIKPIEIIYKFHRNVFLD